MTVVGPADSILHEVASVQAGERKEGAAADEKSSVSRR